MKNVLLMVHADSGEEGRYQTALDLTRALNGHLTCVDVFVPQVIADDYYMGSGSAIMMADELAVERAHGAKLQERLARENVSWNWIDAAGGLSARVTDAAGLADVIVSSRQGDRLLDPNLHRVTTDLVFANPQPIVAAPATSRGVDWHGKALVGWDGSRAAMAALRGAAPLLALADAVELVEIDDRMSGPAAEDAAVYLSRHGVASTIVRRHSHDRPVAELIERHADAIGAAYIVMGAYGHGRVRELFFGGVTRQLMTTSAYPLVLAH